VARDAWKNSLYNVFYTEDREGNIAGYLRVYSRYVILRLAGDSMIWNRFVPLRNGEWSIIQDPRLNSEGFP
jgi:hypothetical protein